MSNKRRVFVSIYHRGRFSLGENRTQLQHGAFHWSIVTAPKSSKGADNRAYDVTDGIVVLHSGQSYSNTDGDWHFRSKADIDPNENYRLVGRIIIGKIPNSISDAEIEEILARMSLPLNSAIPKQNCVSWTWNAIRALQDAEIIQRFNMDQFAVLALAFADHCMLARNPWLTCEYSE